MRVVLQRAKSAEICINGGERRAIGPGLVLLVGVAPGDDGAIAARMAEKCAALRIFESEAGRMDRSAQELGLSALVVSNFTLYADTRRGRRPSFDGAAPPSMAEGVYDAFVAAMRQQGLAAVATGEFGADMQVGLVNDGPVTLLLDSDDWQRPRRG